MKEVVLLLSADLDIQDAFNYHESCQDGGGAVFLHFLEVALEQLRRFPHSGAIYKEPYRRLLMLRFPYGVFYTVESQRSIVSAVINTRRNREFILERLFRDR